MAPALVLTRFVMGLVTRHPPEHLTWGELATLIATAPQEGAISAAELALLGNLMSVRDIMLTEVLTPRDMIFMMEVNQTIGNLLDAPEADAFSRIPVFQGDRTNVAGYVLHREVLKAFALDYDRGRKLGTLRHPIPVLAETLPVRKAVEQLLAQREAIALVANGDDTLVGLVTLEDLVEAISGWK